MGAEGVSTRLGVVSLLVSVLLIGLAALAWADTDAPARPRALVVSIDGEIGLGQVPLVERALREAKDAGVAIVVCEINTFGGRVDAAVAIRDHLVRSETPTVAFINPRAISAGALIALAAERIVIAPGGTIGAATPVQMGAPGEAPTPTDEKTLSYVRKEFRATADARGRPGLFAEAMVDADVAIEGVIEKGKLLTLTTEDALRHGIADAQAANLDELFATLGIVNPEVERVEVNWAERVLRFLTHPAIASLLMTLGLLGLVIELRTPGFGVPGLVGFLCLAAFFGGHWIVNLVGWEQLSLVGLGLVLLALEVFVIPGFGVAGIAGIVALGAGLATSLFGAGASFRVIAIAVSHVTISSAVALVLSLVVLRFLPSLPGGHRFVLASAITQGDRPTANQRSLVGRTGTTLTALRPAGIATIDGRRVDVVSEGGYIEREQPIIVARDEGSRVVVQLLGATSTPRSSHG